MDAEFDEWGFFASNTDFTCSGQKENYRKTKLIRLIWLPESILKTFEQIFLKENNLFFDWLLI